MIEVEMIERVSKIGLVMFDTLIDRVSDVR